MSFPVQLRRTFGVPIAILALGATLSSCGFDHATDRVNTLSNCTSDRSGTVDVLCAVIVSGQDGSGTFVASLSNNSTEDAHAMSAVTGQGIEAAEFEPVEIAPDSVVNLAEPAAGIHVTGEFAAGDFVPVTVEFEAGDSVTLNAHVVPADAGTWEGLDSSGGTGETETESEEAPQ